MAEHQEHEESKAESLIEKVHDHDSSSSSDSDNEKTSSSPSTKSKIFKIFGREKPVHKVLGGGKHFQDFREGKACLQGPWWRKTARVLTVACVANWKIFKISGRGKPVHKVLDGGKPADIFLWRNRKISGSVIGVATGIWVLFELVEYHLLTLVCHLLILTLAVLFLWSNASTFINKSPPQIPELYIPEEPVLQFVTAVRTEINRAFAILRDVTSGRDLKRFISVIAGLWVLSIIGGWCNCLTLFYIAFVLLHTLPVLYEKYEDRVDSFAEKATVEIRKQYAMFDEKVLSKIPRGPLKDRKKD